MTFPLTDLRRTYGRSGAAGGPPDVRPYLLAGAELGRQRARLERVLAWYEGQVGRARAGVSFDDLAAAAGDYRLARCLAACLKGTYAFLPVPFEQAVVAGTADAALAPDRRRWTRLLEHGVASPGALRLHVFERVAQSGGFARPESRDACLAESGAPLGLAADHLDRLLWLDAEEREVLSRVGPVPDPAALAARYNRRAVQTLFVRALGADFSLPAPDGAAVRRLFFLVKRHGLLCDLDLLVPAEGVAGGVAVHLFSPLEVFGPRTRHGERFARAVAALLRAFPDLSGDALVLVNEREYRLHLERRIAEAIRLPDMVAPDADEPEDAAEFTAVVAAPDDGPTFDSEVEAQLYRTLKGMEVRADTSGWRVARESEPIVQAGTVLIPDFTCARRTAGAAAAQRVFVEVIGFWTPQYRERKREKLRRLAGHVPLVLVVQEQLVAGFADLPFPLLPYKHRVSAVDLVRLLDREFRRSAAGVTAAWSILEAHLRATAPEQALLSEADLRAALGLTSADRLTDVLSAGSCVDALGAHPGRSLLRESELGAPATPSVATHQDRGSLAAGGLPAGALPARLATGRPGWQWIPGVGLCRDAWLADLHDACLAALATAGDALPLEDLRASLGASHLSGAPLAAGALEALLPHLGFQVSWTTLFDATVHEKRPLSHAAQEEGAGGTAAT